MYSSYFLFDDLVPRAILAQWDQNFSEVYMQQIHKLVVAFFLNILKVVFLLLQGGPPPAPPCTPCPSGGVRPIGQEITEIRRRNMKHNPLKCRGLWLVREWNRKKMYPPGWKTLCLGQKNSEKNIYFSWKNCFFSLRSKKATIFPREIKVRLRIFLSLAYCFQQGGTYILKYQIG